MRKLLFAVVSALILTPASAQTQAWKDKSLGFHERAKALVAEMTLDEKINQVGHQTLSIDRLGLKGYNYWSEALHGVARSGKATSFPSSKAMASTWNRQLIYDCAWITSDEARIYNNMNGKGLTYWCPTINMSRDPRWGRDEEDYGEDPFLTGSLAVQYVRAMQGDSPYQFSVIGNESPKKEGGEEASYYKTIATIKHFAANNYEKGRHSGNSAVNERNLREYYLPAFEMCVKQANARSLMSAYNRLNGIPCGANRELLTDILRKEWGFTGFVVSDCGAVDDVYQSNRHNYVNTAEEACAVSMKNGEDLNCGGTFQDYCKSAIQKGLMTEADLDSALVRVLEARFSVGEFDSKADVPWTNISSDLLECDAHVQKAYEAEQQAIVLLKNAPVSVGEGLVSSRSGQTPGQPLLPLDRTKSVALIGPLAREVSLGGYSGSPTKLMNPLEGVAEKIGFVVSDGTVKFVDFDGSNVTPGSKRLTREANGSSGNVGYINNNDWISFSEIDFGGGRTKADFLMGGKSSTTTVKVFLDEMDSTPEATATIKPSGNWSVYNNTIIDLDPKVFCGKHKVFFQFSYTGGSDKYAANAATVKFYDPAITDPLQADGPLYFVKGCAVTATGTSGDSGAGVSGQEGDSYKTELERAVAIAKKADYVIFVGGTNLAVSDEGNDRQSLALPGDQQKLLEAVYAANPNLVLVLETCGSMSINWAQENVPAIVEAWYGGQMQGRAIADVLYGDCNPSGKLTSTWYDTKAYNMPALANQSYNIDEAKLTYMYHDKKPLYPFGYGLSYTTFEYSDMQVNSALCTPNSALKVTATIKNTGAMDGAEIVQLYANWNGKGKNGEKNRKLIGFERVELKAGESKTVSIPVSYDQFSYFDTSAHNYQVEDADVTLELAASSADIRQTATIHTAAGVAKETYISENADRIETITNGAALKSTDHIYTIMGTHVCQAADYDSLPAGIYVLNGRKYIKKLY